MIWKRIIKHAQRRQSNKISKQMNTLELGMNYIDLKISNLSQESAFKQIIHLKMTGY